jgi:hypothetical protein
MSVRVDVQEAIASTRTWDGSLFHNVPGKFFAFNIGFSEFKMRFRFICVLNGPDPSRFSRWRTLRASGAGVFAAGS